MKDNIKKFEIPNDANNYKIEDVPFVSTIVSTNLNLWCEEQNKKLVNNNGVVVIEDRPHFYSITNLMDCEINMHFCAAADDYEFVKLKMITENGNRNVYGVDANGNTRSICTLINHRWDILGHYWGNLYITKMPTGSELEILNTIGTEHQQNYRTYYSYGYEDVKPEWYVWNGQEDDFGHTGGYTLYLDIDYPDKSSVQCDGADFDSLNNCWSTYQVYDDMMIITFTVDGETISFGFSGD